jgi:hypothetical protein
MPPSSARCRAATSCWIGAVAVPHLISNDLDSETGDVLFSCYFVVVILAVIPWRHVWARYVRTPGDAWR